MKCNQIGRMIACLLLCAVMAGLLPTRAQAKTEKVRVGLYEKEAYHSIDENGIHGGYDHEYLNKIAYYTGWEYEYVTGTWDECMDMLASGQIDLLGGVEWSQERTEKMYFPSISSMSVVSCLLQDDESDQYSFEDFEYFGGMRIGLMKSSNQVDTMRRLSEEKGFSYTPVLYDTESEMQDALESGEVDCVFMDNCRDMDGYSILCYYSYTPLYYVVSLSRPDLAKKLETALEKIRIQEPEFEYNLYSKYFEYAQNISLTQKEREYIQNQGPIEVCLNLEISALLCRWDKKEERYIGLMPDTMDLLSERTGLTFEYVPMPGDLLPGEYLKDHPNSIIAPAVISSLVDHDRGFQLLEPIYKGKMLTITRSGHTMDTQGSFILAVPRKLYRQEDHIQEMFPNATLIPCATHRAGMELVASGVADMSLANEFATAYEIQSPFFEGLQSTNFVDITEDLTLGLGYQADPELVSILAKAILSLDERDTRDLVLNDTAAISYDISLDEFLYNRRYAVLLLLILLVGTLYIIEERKRNYENRKKDRQSLIAAEERLRADREHQKIMFRQANFDELTGLYNQKYFVEKANERMRADPDQTFRFLWINLKGFRMFNDLYGVEAGDAVLKDMAECMRHCIGEKGIYGRMYADRFAVCIPTDCQINFMDQCVRRVDFKGKLLKIHVAIGVYEDFDGCRDAARCMNYALIALENGNFTDASPISFFDASQLDAMRTRQWITNDMERALQEEQFQVYFQPQYDMDGKRLVGVEALARWYHPEHSLISPGVFIPIFENNRFIHKFSAYMCDHVCAMLAQWLKEGKAVPVSVNLSQLDLVSPNLIPMLLDILKKHNVPAEYLRLEVTESAYAENQNEVIEISDKLRSLGFKLEMDDFGSGYSSLNMLKDVTVDTVKLDMRFLSSGTDSRRSSLIIDYMVKMAHSIGISVIAEGVETEQDAAFLHGIGCRLVQGYLYGRPMSASDFSLCLAGSTLGDKNRII